LAKYKLTVTSSDDMNAINYVVGVGQPVQVRGNGSPYTAEFNAAAPYSLNVSVNGVDTVTWSFVVLNETTNFTVTSPTMTITQGNDGDTIIVSI